jgi:hypothetical protein
MNDINMTDDNENAIAQFDAWDMRSVELARALAREMLNGKDHLALIDPEILADLGLERMARKQAQMFLDAAFDDILIHKCD